MINYPITAVEAGDMVRVDDNNCTVIRVIRDSDSITLKLHEHKTDSTFLQHYRLSDTITGF